MCIHEFTYLNIHVCKYMHQLDVSTYTNMCTCKRIYLNTYLEMTSSVTAAVLVIVHVDVCMCMCVCVCACVCMCVYIYIHIDMYI